jgi:tetratricopeptide (TPR) repeat protein
MMIGNRLWPRLTLAACIALVLPLAANHAAAQESAAGSGKVHGAVTDPAGAPMTTGTVSLYLTSNGGGVTPEQDAKYTLPLDGSGNFKGDNVAAGTYTLIYREPTTPKTQVVDQIDGIKVTPGADTEANLDMSRAAYIAKLSPEQRKALEEAKAKNATILKENSTIKNLNADLATARSDDKNKNFADAVALMQKDANIKPDAAVLWVELGLAQAGKAETDKTQPSTAAASGQELTEAEANLQKGLTMDQASKKPDPVMEGAAEDKLGEAYVIDGKIPDAQAAYDAAAKANPTSAGMYYENETIMMDRLSGSNPAAADGIVPAADKAIAADPNRPIPYYLKGRALVSKATIDPKTQKIVAPAGCEDAYQKYLQLAPAGPFAPEAKQILAEMDQTQSSSYKASKKH